MCTDKCDTGLSSSKAGKRKSRPSDKFAEAVFVLHCFQKKSKRRVATPKKDMDIIRARLKVAEALAKEIRNAKANH